MQLFCVVWFCFTFELEVELVCLSSKSGNSGESWNGYVEGQRLRKRRREEVVCKDFPKPGSHRPGSEYLNREKLVGALRLSHLPDWEFQKTEVGVWWKEERASWVCDLCSGAGPGAQRPTLGLGSTVNILKFSKIF